MTAATAVPAARPMLFPSPRQTPPARVVVTGAGIVTALGLGWFFNSEGFRTGRSGIRPVTLFDVTRQRSRIAAEVDLPPLARTGMPAQRPAARWDRATQMLWLATAEAWFQAGWATAPDTPLVLGTTGGGMALGEEYVRHALQHPGTQRRQATRVVNYQAQRQARDVGLALGVRGPITIISNACASGANAIGHAWELIRNGRAERVLTGGYDALCPLIYAGFDSLQALAPTPCRPFDAERNGLSLGEGAAVLALESLASAQAHGAEILGEIIGYAAATDVHHLTQPHPQGDAAFITMTEACAIAGLGPEAVDYVNAHGTATPQNDATEAAAINRWAGSRAANLPVSSTKASVGHLLGAAGAVEAVVALMALRGQWLPPESTLRMPDPACTFPLVQQPTTARVNVVLSNSFGFGGANATLVLRRWT
ncbi:MAG TPA: beta-ketoacyl-[acyl-carrier-protein] synthase family protein [Verrucomicrobiae bacterium]|nr:beta-ketoacyl-[acyl-carrier-protein] synthase family protein [Verrucomicrobiae bacterium]